MGGTALVLVAGLATLSMRASSPELGLLFTDLDPAQAQAVTEKLKSLNVPFELTRDASGVLAPVDRLPELRMELASEQITGQVGYELLDHQDPLGTTAFLQNVNHIRAIEGELARSITSLSPVQKARVHLSIPERALFEQQHQKPSAAITLKTRARLSAGQVNAIRNLVAASVPELEPGRISIIDQNGTLLAQSGSDDASGVSAAMEDRRVALESKLRQDVETLLERIVGPGRVRAEVAAELEHETIRQEADVFDPDKQVVARSTTVERGEQNQDNQSDSNVTVANNLPETQAAPQTGAQSSSAANETSEQVDYQNSRTRTTTIRDPGAVKRLSVAVLVDGVYTKGANGKSTYTPRSPQELEQLTRLVRNAIGYDTDRGDSVVVENLKFAEPEDLNADSESGLPLGLESKDLIKIAQTLVIGLLGILALFLIVRPMLRKTDPNSGIDSENIGLLGGPEERLALAPPDSGVTAELIERAAAGDEEAIRQIQDARESNQGRLSVETEIDVAQIEGKVKSSALRKVGEVINRNPEEAVSIIRQWMYT